MAAGHQVAHMEYEIGGDSGYARIVGDAIQRSAQFRVLLRKSANIVDAFAGLASAC